MRTPLPPLPDRAGVAALAARYLDGVLGEAETAELNTMLAADGEARRVFVALTLQSRWISETFTERMQIAATVRVKPTRRPLHFAYGVAAALAVIGAAAAVYVATFGLVADDGADRPGAQVAMVTEAADVAWLSEPLNAGDEIAPQTVSAESGRMELMLASGTQMNLAGPVEVRLIDAMHVSLVSGQATFTCGPSAHGFTVRAPGVTIVDLGTRFAVRVDGSGRTVLDVVEGEVEYRFTDASRTGGRLTTGATVRIDGASGQVTALAPTERLVRRPAPRVIITEIMYDPVGDDRGGMEWVEITNIGATTVDVSGWTLRDEDFGGTGTGPIAAGTVIAPGRSLVIIPDVGMGAQDAVSRFRAAWGDAVAAAAVTDFASGKDVKRGLRGLSSTASKINEILTLRDEAGNTVDVLNYQVSGGWPDHAEGSSIYLLPKHQDAKANDDGRHWARSRADEAGAWRSRTAGPFTGQDVGSPGVTATDSTGDVSHGANGGQGRLTAGASDDKAGKDDEQHTDPAGRSDADDR